MFVNVIDLKTVKVTATVLNYTIESKIRRILQAIVDPTEHRCNSDQLITKFKFTVGRWRAADSHSFCSNSKSLLFTEYHNKKEHDQKCSHKMIENHSSLKLLSTQSTVVVGETINVIQWVTRNYFICLCPASKIYPRITETTTNKNKTKQKGFRQITSHIL